jgi:hypothetical protein
VGTSDSVGVEASIYTTVPHRSFYTYVLRFYVVLFLSSPEALGNWKHAPPSKWDCIGISSRSVRIITWFHHSRKLSYSYKQTHSLLSEEFRALTKGTHSHIVLETPGTSAFRIILRVAKLDSHRTGAQVYTSHSSLSTWTQTIRTSQIFFVSRQTEQKS